MPKTRQQKEDIAIKITDKLSRSKSVVFADYQGLTMSEFGALRDQLREVGAEFSVTKNNLLKIALENSKLSTPNSEFLNGPIATLFAYKDEIAPIKVLVKALKDAQKGQIKGGIMEGEYLDQYSVTKLSTLPSKDELRAKVVGSLGAPLYGIVGVLQANLRNLVYALDQIRVAKGGE
jgi:large subunit ribosomal protein L10